jgi:hypothetical protein
VRSIIVAEAIVCPGGAPVSPFHGKAKIMKALHVVQRAIVAASVLALWAVLCGCQPEPAPPAKPAPDKKAADLEKAPAPAKQETEVPAVKPAEEEKKPAAEEKKPAPEEQKPPAEEKKPAVEEKKPATEEKKPAAEEKTPPAEEKKPAAEEKKPAAEEKTPATEEKKPAAEEKDKKDKTAGATEQSAVTPAKPKEEPAPAVKPRDLGPPLVDDPKGLTKLDPVQPVWVDKAHEQVVFMAETCRADYPLEFFATLRDRGYESCVVTDVRPSIVHAALLAVGAKPGTPAKFDPKYTPPSGTEIAIEVRWKDKDGKQQTGPAQNWVRDVKTKKPMSVDWVFSGSGFRVDPETHESRYMADGGDFIAVLNLPTAMLDIPIPSASALESRSYEGFVENMPPKATPVTVILKPKLK